VDEAADERWRKEKGKGKRERGLKELSGLPVCFLDFLLVGSGFDTQGIIEFCFCNHLLQRVRVVDVFMYDVVLKMGCGEGGRINGV